MWANPAACQCSQIIVGKRQPPPLWRPNAPTPPRRKRRVPEQHAAPKDRCHKQHPTGQVSVCDKSTARTRLPELRPGKRSAPTPLMAPSLPEKPLQNGQFQKNLPQVTVPTDTLPIPGTTPVRPIQIPHPQKTTGPKDARPKVDCPKSDYPKAVCRKTSQPKSRFSLTSPNRSRTQPNLAPPQVGTTRIWPNQQPARPNVGPTRSRT